MSKNKKYKSENLPIIVFFLRSCTKTKTSYFDLALINLGPFSSNLVLFLTSSSPESMSISISISVFPSKGAGLLWLLYLEFPIWFLLCLFGDFVNLLCTGFLSLVFRVLASYFWCGHLYCLLWDWCFALGFLIAWCLTLDHLWRRLQIPSKNCCTPFFMGLLSHWMALYTNVKPANERRFFEKNYNLTFAGNFLRIVFFCLGNHHMFHQFQRVF